MKLKILCSLSLMLIMQQSFCKQWIFFYAANQNQSQAFVSFVQEDSITDLPKLVNTIGCHPLIYPDVPYIVQRSKLFTNNLSTEVGIYFAAEVTDAEWVESVKIAKSLKSTEDGCLEKLVSISKVLENMNQPGKGSTTPFLYVSKLRELNGSAHMHGKMSHDLSKLTAQKKLDLALPASPDPTVPNQTSVYKLTPAEDSLKIAALRFYSWYEHTWKYGKKPYEFDMILNRSGKPVTDESACPCSINKAAVAKFFAWMQSNAPTVSTIYLAKIRTQIAMAEASMKSAKKLSEHIGAIEQFYIPYLSFFERRLGQDAPNHFENMGFFSDKTLWQGGSSGNLGGITTTFKMPGGYSDAGESSAYALRMVFEKGQWKIAAPLEEGAIQTSEMKITQ